MGLGSGLGALLGGMFYKRVGFSLMFLAIGLIVLVFLVGFMFGNIRLRNFRSVDLTE
jgi:hypothetical protein